MKKSRKHYPCDNKTTVRITPELHKRIVAAAKQDTRTIEAFVANVFESALSQIKKI